MRKPGLALLVLALAASCALAVSACGSGGTEGGTLKGTYASFPDYLDPQLSYTAEGWTAMFDTYIPLLTYKHAGGREGSEVIPGLARAMPKITGGGKTYTLYLRKGLRYSDGEPVRASDFAYAVERMFRLNSAGSSLYTDIVGAKRFAEAKSGAIAGIRADDETGKIVIHLLEPRGTFTNELGLLFAAPVPKGTPARNLSADPPPATGPYAITSSEPGRGWRYERNPAWARVNAKLMPEIPSGHVDAIEIEVVHNPATQVNEIESGKADWMQTPPPPDLYAEVKGKYEGTQFRVEPSLSTYYFWMNTKQPPFDERKVRQAVNYAIDTRALERIYAGQLTASHQVLPPGMPGHEPFDLYPHNLAKAKRLIAEADPSDRKVTVWSTDESPSNEAGAYYQGVLEELGFDAKLKEINADAYATIIGNLQTPDLDTGWGNWLPEYAHPNSFFALSLTTAAIQPTNNFNFAQYGSPKTDAKVARLAEETLGPKQEAEYAALDREVMQRAPWAPFGTATLSTFVSGRVDLDKVIWNPTFGDDLTSFRFG